MRKVKIAFCIFLALLVLTGILYFVNARMNEKVYLRAYTVHSEKVPKGFDGYKIFVISDLHDAPFHTQIIRHIENAKPDILLFLGDLVQLPEGRAREAKKIAEAFSGEIPIYAVSGDHESQNEAYWDIYDTLHFAGVTWLTDDRVVLEKDGDSILLIGLSNSKDSTVSKEEILEKRRIISEETEAFEGFSILLNHRSDMYPDIKDAGADLILSGDSHGGIIRLPFLGGVYGNHGTFPNYEYGIYEEEESTLIVSGGCDKNIRKMRVWNPPEVLLVTLERE